MDKKIDINKLKSEAESNYTELLIEIGHTEEEAKKESKKTIDNIFYDTSVTNQDDAREIISLLGMLIELNPPVMNGFPRDGTFKEKKKWIKTQFAAELKRFPATVTAGEVKKTYDKYCKTLHTSKAKLSPKESFSLRCSLHELLGSYHFALPMDSYAETKNSIAQNEKDIQRYQQEIIDAQSNGDNIKVDEITRNMSHALSSKKRNETRALELKDQPSYLSSPLTSSRLLFKEAPSKGKTAYTISGILIAIFILAIFIAYSVMSK